MVDRVGAIFICYRRSDSEDITGRLNEKLVEQFGKQRVFRDVYNIAPGLDYDVAIRQALDETDVLLVVIGDRWDLDRLVQPDDTIRREIEQAMARSIRIIPLLVRAANMPPRAALPASIVGFERFNALQLRGDPDFHNDIARLIEAVRPRLSRRSPAWIQRVRRWASGVPRPPPARTPQVPRWLPAWMPRGIAGRIAIAWLAIAVAIAAGQGIIEWMKSSGSRLSSTPRAALEPAEGSQADTPSDPSPTPAEGSQAETP